MRTEDRPHLHVSRPLGQPRKPSENGHSSGTADTNGLDRSGQNARATARHALALLPRVLGLEAASHYLGVSVRTIQYLVEAGTLKRVRIPMPDGGDLRKLLLDRQDLDALVERGKE